MAPRLLVSLSIVLLALLDVSSAVAQPVLDRIVGLAVSEHPVIITRVDGQAIKTTARGGRGADGFEGFSLRRSDSRSWRQSEPCVTCSTRWSQPIVAMSGAKTTG